MAARLNAAQWRVVLLLMGFSFLGYVNRVGMSVAGTERLMQDYAISEEQMGAVYSAFLLIYTFLMIPGGWLIERVGPRRALGCMGLGSAALMILTGLPGWGLVPAFAAFPAFLLIRGALGAMAVPMYPGAARAISLWLPATGRAWGNGMVTGAALLGIAATYSLFGVLMDKLTWPGAFLATGFATAALTGAWLLTTTDDPMEPVFDNAMPPSTNATSNTRETATFLAQPGLKSLVSLLHDRSLVLVSISYGAYGYFQYLFFYWVEHYFLKILDLGKEQSRINSTIVSLTMALGMVTGGFLSDRLQALWGARRGRAAVAVGAMTASALFALAGIHFAQPERVVVYFALSMGMLGMCEGPFWTTGVDLGGRQGGLAAAILNTGGNIGGTLAPFATPLFAHYFSWRAGIEVGCLFCVIGAVLWFWITPTARRTG